MGGVLVMKLVFIYYLVLNSMAIFCCSSMQLNHWKLDGNETDRLALLAIKAQIQHDPNQMTSSWNDSLHFCVWHGITCSRRHPQRVTKLELDSLALVGSVSPYIGNLSFLRVLDLQNNSLTQQIPPQIGQLRRLQVLRLNNNSFGGTIPPNISYCFKLTRLVLGKNDLMGQIPPQLTSLSKLQYLNLRDINNLTGEIPSSLGNLSSLKEISITNSNIEGSIPNSICQLKKLLFFYFGANKLSGVFPSCIYNLSGILRFEIGYNRIQGSLPSNMFDVLPKLQYISISSNHFTGAIPPSLSNATSLQWFTCAVNKLTGQVPNLGKLHNLERFVAFDNDLGSSKDGDLSFVSELINATSLTWLDFGLNNFAGTLPSSISNLSTNLQRLLVDNNQLYGSIPTGLVHLVNLQVLVMSQSSFTGSIPTDIGRLSGLGPLLLDNNQLSGSIPSSIGNLTLSTELELQENDLEGSIPSSIGKCHWLLKLDLSGNKLNGTIPPQIFALSSLSTVLALSSNQFVGSLPIGNLKGLGVLDVSNNLLSGELPNSLGSYKSLEGLYLQDNFFLGPIPSSMKDLRGLRILDLSRNNLSGDIPQFLQNLNLENLNLSFNQFWGAVPIAGVFKNASAISVAENPGLCGGIANLRLPNCKSNESKGGLSRRMKLMISLVFGLTLVGLVVVSSLFLFGKKRKQIKLSTLRSSVWQVSYATLLKATEGFSSTNLIGVGAFGSVYKGVLDDARIVVAVKVLNMFHRGASKSFMAECEALRNIRHRNLVKILTACSSIDFGGNDFKALVYEFMENGSLEEWLHQSIEIEEVTQAPKILSLVQRLDIAIDVASALDYLHNNCEPPIVHCDLKPSNVLLDSDLTGHVSDFGLSSFLSEPTTNISGNHSSSIGIRGSVGYVAPEYGMGSEVSGYGDIYSFGILLLEMFTGKRPTDDMFTDNLNLHNYVKTTIPEYVSKISESSLLQESVANVVDPRIQLSVRTKKIEECLTLIFGIGIACSAECPTNRKHISDVVVELRSIRKNILG